jgi:hypothetical protein
MRKDARELLIIIVLGGLMGVGLTLSTKPGTFFPQSPLANRPSGWILASSEAPPRNTPLIGLWEIEDDPGHYEPIAFERIGLEWLYSRSGPARRIPYAGPPIAWQREP